MTGSITILTGPAGAGKTTVARTVAAMRPHAVHLHTDDFWGFIVSGGILPYLPDADRQNHTVLDAIAAAAVAYAKGGYEVVADGVVGPWMLDHYTRAAAAPPGIPLRYVVLRPGLEVTLRRALARTAPDALTDGDVVTDLWHKFSQLGELESHAIDTSSLDLGETVQAVEAAMASSDFLL